MKPEEDENLVQKIYNNLFRPYLPNKISVHNSVPVKDYSKLFDFSDEFPEYEDALISAIREQINQRDSIVLVGGGWGVSTVAAVEATGRTGSVETYEGSAKQYEVIQNTIRLNKVEKFVDVNHSIVGSYLEHSSESYGDSGKADVVNPSALSECDVLVLDCEGAEIEILRNLSHLPRIIIVETHGFLQSPEEEIREILTNKGYEVINRGVEIESKGVYVLTAVR